MDTLDPRKYLPGGSRDFQARSVMATFPEAGSARSAEKELREAGFKNVQVDEVSWRPSERGRLEDQPWPQTLVGPESWDQRVAGAVDPSASGLAKGGTGLVGGHQYLLTVALDESGESGKDMERAVEIIRKKGGNVDTGGPR